MPRRRWLRAALIVLCCLGAAPPGLSGLGGDAQAPAGEEGLASTTMFGIGLAKRAPEPGADAEAPGPAPVLLSTPRLY